MDECPECKKENIGKIPGSIHIEREIHCPKCQKILGWFDGKTAKRNDGIQIKQGKIYFFCTNDGSEVEVCKNDLKIKLLH